MNSYSESHNNHLSLRNVLVGVGEALHVLGDETVATQELDVGTVLLELALLAHLDVLLAADGGEAPVLGDNDLLAAGELVHGAAESLDGGSAVGVTGADGQEDLADVHTGNETLGLTEGTTHTGLETIGTSARQHLVDTDDVEGVHTDAQVETFLTGDLHEVPIGKGLDIEQTSRERQKIRADDVLVGTNTGSLEGLGGQLLILVGDEVNTGGEVVNVGLLATEVEDADLGVGDTTVEPGLGVGL